MGLCGGFTWRTVATNLLRLKLAVVAECGLFNNPSWQQQELSATMRWALVLPSRQTIIAGEGSQCLQSFKGCCLLPLLLPLLRLAALLMLSQLTFLLVLLLLPPLQASPARVVC